MQQAPMRMDAATMSSATYHSREYVRRVTAQALEMAADPAKPERTEAAMCIACFYRGPRIGGAAMTDRPCGICGTTMHFSSTATDALCPACAKKHELCKCCGGDVHMHDRRRKWPEVKGRP